MAAFNTYATLYSPTSSIANIVSPTTNKQTFIRQLFLDLRCDSNAPTPIANSYQVLIGWAASATTGIITRVLSPVLHPVADYPVIWDLDFDPALIVPATDGYLNAQLVNSPGTVYMVVNVNGTVV